MTAPTSDAPDRLLAQTLREEAGPLVARLAREFHDFDLAEEAVQGAVVEALEAWRRDGPPDKPAAWLQVAARHNALDLVRRRGRQDALARRAGEPAVDSDQASYDGGTDDRLALLFACCHPALAPEARLALTLRAVVGMTTPQIARAFLVNERTLAQRIVRAKRKIVTAGIALTVPAPDALTERLTDVLAVVALMYNEGFVSSDGPTQDRDLAGDAVWLAGVVATSLPDEAEAWGLAALLSFQHARAAARFDDLGSLVLLPDQDRSRWDAPTIRGGARRCSSGPPACTRRGRSRSRPPSPPVTPPARRGRRPTGCRSSPSTTCSAATTPPRSSGSTAPSRSPGWVPTTSRRRWPRSTPSPSGSTATTSSTPPAPSSSPPWAVTTRPTLPTHGPSA